MKSFIIKNWLALLSIFLTIGLTLFGIIVNNSIQDKLQELEITNRTQLFRPLITLKNSIQISKITLNRDASILAPKYDYQRGVTFKDSSKILDIPMLLNANFGLTIINNSEQIADILATFFTDTATAVQYSIEDIFSQLNKNKNEAEGQIHEELIQLNYQDSIVIEFDNYRIRNFKDNLFYLHLFVIYTNQVGDYYISYFVIKAKTVGLTFAINEKIKKQKFDLMRIKKVYMKNSFIKYEILKPYTKSLTKEEIQMFDEFTNFKSEEYLRKKEAAKKILNK